MSNEAVRLGVEFNDAKKLWKLLKPEMTEEAKEIVQDLRRDYYPDLTEKEQKEALPDKYPIYAGRTYLTLLPLIFNTVWPADHEIHTQSDDFTKRHVPDTVLDLGCGVGFLAPFCDATHIKYIGIDLDIREDLPHAKFYQNKQSEYVRYLNYDISKIDEKFLRDHSIDPNKTLCLALYVPCMRTCVRPTELAGKLAQMFQNHLFL